jgi:beta-glucosidase
LGIVLNLGSTEAGSSAPEDMRKAYMDDARGRRWYTDPLFKAHYPQEIWDELGTDAPQVLEGDLEHISTPIDFLGVNYYTRQVAFANHQFDVKTSGLALTEMDWEIYPKGLTDLLLLLHKEYKLPKVYITENGGAFKDPVTQGQIHDADRTDYLQTHIAAVGKAIAAGVPVHGYMVWSLMDNFEWSSGYAKRFGIVHVDYNTQKRTLKDSALWYRDFLQKFRSAKKIEEVA